jgi:hypothetical protein
MSALIMHVYQMRSTDKQVVDETQKRLHTCMNALKEVSKVWLVAKMVYTLFESILGNKTLEERLQKAAGKRHRKPQQVNMKVKEEQQKRKFDEMDNLGFTNGPAHQVSYERSRPQTPALTPNRDTNGNQMSTISPELTRQQNEQPLPFGMAHASRGNTRPTTPFNPALYTAPDLILVTRNSPDISHSEIWENFQPDQLFPAEHNLGLPFSVSPMQSHTLVDPALSATSGAQHNNQHNMLGNGPGTPSGMHHNHNMMQNNIDPNGWGQMDMGMGANEDTWSNSSKGQGPIVPTSLNVEDWYVFFFFFLGCSSRLTRTGSISLGFMGIVLRLLVWGSSLIGR